jgi:PPK2 family polyphosphate:nucleotide phosphotransferase
MDRKARAQLERMIEPYRVTRRKRFRLKDFDPDDTGKLNSNHKDEANARLQNGVAWLAEEQDKLYAQDRWAVLLVFQAMDAAGKDSTIKHVMSGLNPQGCQVTAFKQPSSEELDHDYLWRCMRHVPARGMIGIFNRSYYEEVLVVRVHPEYLHAQKLAPQLVTGRIWKERYADIANFEEYLARNGVVILKFFLHVSREEQKRRFLARLDEPHKNWKFSAGDVKERMLWDRYQEAYEDAIRHTAAKHAPWYVVPADNKWYTRLVVAGAVVAALADLKLAYPQIDAGKRRELARARRELLAQKP